MRNTIRILTGAVLAVLGVAALVSATDGSRSDLVVHEWGTFLAMNGSDGVALDGMYHEEHALPAFVHARSHDQLRLRSVDRQGRDAGHLLLRDAAATGVGARSDFPAVSGRSGTRRRRLRRPDARADRLAARTRATVASAGRSTSCHRPWQRRNFRRRAPMRSGTTRVTWMRPTSARDDQTRHGSPEGVGAIHLLSRARRSDAATRRAARRGGAHHRAAPTAPPGVRHLFVLRVEGGQGALSVPARARRRSSVSSTSMPRWTAALPIDRFVAGARRRSGTPSGGERPVREGGPRDGQHVAQQLLHDRRLPRAVRAAAVVDRSVHPAAHHPAAARDRPRDGRPRGAADARSGSARAEAAISRPRLAGPGGARAGLRHLA